MYLAQSRKSLEMDIPFDYWSIIEVEKLFRKNLVDENEKKISSLKKEIARINDQISDIEKENINLRQKIKKLGGLDE